MTTWQHIENPRKGMVNEISSFINELEKDGKIFLPDLRQTENLYLFSDYSANKDQKLITYSILILDEKSYNWFLSAQEKFWEEYSLDSKIIEYKKLNDGPRKRALVAFLDLCNKINGLIFTIVIHKDTKSLYKDEIPVVLQEQINVWKKKAVKEKILRLREFILLILNGLGRQNQNVLWITDNDEIVANELQLFTANAIFKDILEKHLDFKIGTFELKTLDDDLPDKRFEKLCSLTDLIAGALVDFLGDYHHEEIFPVEGEIANPITHVKLKVNPITNWLSKTEKETSLKKIVIKINEIGNNGLSIESYRFPEFI